MSNEFGKKLQEKLDEAGIKAAELARRSGVTKQNIGRLLNNTPHSITGALPSTEKPTVEKLAKALNWDLDDALLAAGYAPENGKVETVEIPQEVKEAFAFEGELLPSDQILLASIIKEMKKNNQGKKE